MSQKRQERVNKEFKVKKYNQSYQNYMIRPLTIILCIIKIIIIIVIIINYTIIIIIIFKM